MKLVVKHKKKASRKVNEKTVLNQTKLMLEKIVEDIDNSLDGCQIKNNSKNDKK